MTIKQGFSSVLLTRPERDMVGCIALGKRWLHVRSPDMVLTRLRNRGMVTLPTKRHRYGRLTPLGLVAWKANERQWHADYFSDDAGTGGWGRVSPY